MKIHQLLLSLAALAALAILPSAAKADGLTFTISNPLQSGAPGSLLTFNGMLNNGAGAISNIVLSDSLAAGLTLTQIFTPMMLASNGSYMGPLFEIMIDNSAMNGQILAGSLAFVYDTATGQEMSNTQDIRVTVTQGGVPPVPEPATMILLGTGLAGAWAAKRRRQRTGDTT